MQTQYSQRMLSQRIAETVRNARRLENLDHNGYSATFVMSGFTMPVAAYLFNYYCFFSLIVVINLLNSFIF